MRSKVVSLNDVRLKKRVEKAKAKVPALQKDLKKIDFKNETQVVRLLTKIGKKLDKMIQVGYENYLEKPGFGNSNSFVSLVNSLQNIIANIRQLRNTEEQVDYIVDKILLRVFTTALLQLQNALLSLKQGLNGARKKELEDAIKNYGEFLTNALEDVRKQIQEYIG